MKQCLLRILARLTCSLRVVISASFLLDLLLYTVVVVVGVVVVVVVVVVRRGEASASLRATE